MCTGSEQMMILVAGPQHCINLSLHHVPPLRLLVAPGLLDQLPLVIFTSAALGPAPPQAAPASTDHRRGGDRVSSRQITRHVALKVVEYPVPPGPRQEVVLGAMLEAGVGRHRVINPPESRGHKVGEEDVDAVVTAGEDETGDPGEADDGAGPVQEDEASRRVCNE